MAMSRKANIQTITIDAGEQTSTVFEVHESIYGSLAIASDFTGTTANFQASSTRGGTFSDVYDADGSQVAVALSVSTWAAVPLDAMKHHTLKLVAVSSQTAAQTITVTLKN